MAVHEVALHEVGETARCAEALTELRSRLGGDSVEEPDGTGMFAVEVEAASFDEAVARVRDAVAASGADECFELGVPGGVPPAD